MANKLYAVSVLALAVAVAPACATKKFVRTEVGNVNTKVDTLSGSLEETQERTRQNEERIGAVDQKAEAAGRSAQDARGAADAAAQSARQVNTRVDQVADRAEHRRGVVAQARLRGHAERGPGQVQVRARPSCRTTAKARLDEVIDQLKADTKNVFIEIEGHTDNVGDKTFNEKLGHGARRSGEAVSLRAAPGAAAQDERDQLRRGEAGCAEQQPRRSRAEPPRRRRRFCRKLDSAARVGE